MCLAATPSAQHTSDGATAILSQLIGCCADVFFATEIGVGGVAADAAGVGAVVTACHERQGSQRKLCVLWTLLLFKLSNTLCKYGGALSVYKWGHS